MFTCKDRRRYSQERALQGLAACLPLTPPGSIKQPCVRCVLGGDAAVVAGFRPVHCQWSHINAPNEPPSRPIVKAYEAVSASSRAFDSQQAAAIELLRVERRLEARCLFEVLEDADLETRPG